MTEREKLIDDIATARKRALALVAENEVFIEESRRASRRMKRRMRRASRRLDQAISNLRRAGLLK